MAARLGIVDLLKDGLKLIEELADSTGINSRNLYCVLRALLNRGIVAEVGDGRFELTPLAEPFQTIIPNSLSGWAIISGGAWHQAWGDLLNSVVAGEPAFDHEFGMGY